MSFIKRSTLRRDGAIEHDLFRSTPVDLMFRYNFVSFSSQNGTLEIALADPRNLNTIDELGLLLHKKLRVKVRPRLRSPTFNSPNLCARPLPDL
jgi:hypothetical protein